MSFQEVPQVTVYTKPGCPFCVRALSLLEKKGVEVQTVIAATDPSKRAEMIARAGGRKTYPQIFVGSTHVGGCDDLVEMDRSGALDRLLGDR